MGAPHPYPLQLFELAEIALDDMAGDDDSIIDFIHDQASAARKLFDKGDNANAWAALSEIRQRLEDLNC